MEALTAGIGLRLNLFTCATSTYNKQYDPDYVELMKPLVDELKRLAVTGVDVVADNVSYKFLARLATLSADNLSAHSLAGFQSHFSHGRICCYCMANHDEICSSLSEDGFCVWSK